MYNDIIEQQKVLYKPTGGKMRMLDNETVQYISSEGKIYSIFGTPFCKIFGNWAYMLESSTLEVLYSQMPENCDIVISHDAPKLCDLGQIEYRENVGNPWLADEILRKHPKYVFCGHIHSGNHSLSTINGISLANVSLLDESYEFNYKPFYLEV